MAAMWTGRSCMRDVTSSHSLHLIVRVCVCACVCLKHFTSNSSWHGTSVSIYLSATFHLAQNLLIFPEAILALHSLPTFALNDNPPAGPQRPGTAHQKQQRRNTPRVEPCCSGLEVGRSAASCLSKGLKNEFAVQFLQIHKRCLFWEAKNTTRNCIKNFNLDKKKKHKK